MGCARVTRVRGQRMASQAEAPPPRASARMDEGSDVGDLMVSDYYMGQLLIAISGFWLLLLLLLR